MLRRVEGRAVVWAGERVVDMMDVCVCVWWCGCDDVGCCCVGGVGLSLFPAQSEVCKGASVKGRCSLRDVFWC